MLKAILVVNIFFIVIRNTNIVILVMVIACMVTLCYPKLGYFVPPAMSDNKKNFFSIEHFLSIIVLFQMQFILRSVIK